MSKENRSSGVRTAAYNYRQRRSLAASLPALQLRPAEAKTIRGELSSMAMLQGDGAVDLYARVAGQQERSLAIGECAKKGMVSYEGWNVQRKR